MMNLSAIYHRPESEYAYLYTASEMRVRIRTALNDIAKIVVVYGDPYDFSNQVWQKEDDIGLMRGLATENH